MNRHLRRIVITIIAVACVGVPVVAIAASDGHGAQAHRGPASRAATPRCSSSELRLSVIAEQGALGTTYWDLGLRNAGRAPCHMRGYPGIGLINANSRLIKDPVEHVPGTPTKPVTLRPGQEAYFTFGYVGEVGACVRHFSAYGVQVVPPHQHQWLVLRSARFDVCTPSRAVANPQVYPIRAGARLNG